MADDRADPPDPLGDLLALAASDDDPDFGPIIITIIMLWQDQMALLRILAGSHGASVPRNFYLR